MHDFEIKPKCYKLSCFIITKIWIYKIPLFGLCFILTLDVMIAEVCMWEGSVGVKAPPLFSKGQPPNKCMDARLVKECDGKVYTS